MRAEILIIYTYLGIGHKKLEGILVIIYHAYIVSALNHHTYILPTNIILSLYNVIWRNSTDSFKVYSLITFLMFM